MKRFSRLFHKWAGLISCIFIMLVSITAIGLNHNDILESYFKSEKSVKEFVFSNATVVSADPFDNKHILASDSKGLFETRNTGKEWKEIKLFVPSENINNIAFDPFNQDKYIISIRDAGLYLTEDNGEVWEEIILPFTTAEGENIQNISFSKNSVNLKTPFGFYNYYFDNEKWDSNKFQNINSSKITGLKQLVYELHTGKFFGSYGVLLYDVISICLILLSISGIYISIRPKLKKNKIVTFAKKTTPIVNV